VVVNSTAKIWFKEINLCCGEWEYSVNMAQAATLSLWDNGICIWKNSV
jgi:hypothetical protein